MDGQHPGQGRNGQQDFSQNFQFSRQQQPRFQFPGNVDDSFTSSTDMNFLSEYPPNIGVSTDQFAFPAFGGTQEAAGTTFGTENAAYPWQSAGAGSALETASNASTVARLATGFQQHTIQSPPQARYAPSESRYSRSEAGSVRHGRVQKHKQRQNSRPTNAVAASSTAGPGTVNDTRSIGVPSERGDLSLAEHSTEVEDGYFQCNICQAKKKPKCDMIKHINTHTKPYKCPYDSCTKGFATKNDRERHERTHTDAKNLRRVYMCNHGKCRLKTKPWPRWDNFKTHLHDVHRVEHPIKEDYHKENPAAQNQYLAGINGQFGPETVTLVSADALTAGEDFSTVETMTLGSQSAALPYLATGPTHTMQVISAVEQVFVPRGNLTTHQTIGNGQYRLGVNATATPVGQSSSNPFLNNQPTPGAHYHHGSSGYSTNLMGLQESATANFQYGHDTPVPRVSYLTTASRRGPQSLGQAAPLSPHQTTHSIHSHNSFNDMSFSHAGNTSSLTSFAAPSLPGTGEGHTTPKMVDVAEISVDKYSQDIAMEDVDASVDLSVDNADYDLAGLAGGEIEFAASPDSHSQGDNISRIDDMITTEAVEPDGNISPNKSVIGDDSITLDTDNAEDTRGYGSYNDASVSTQSPLAINPLDTVLSSSADIGASNKALEVEALDDAAPNRVETPRPAPHVNLAAITTASLKDVAKEDLEKVLKAISDEMAHRNAGVEVLPSTPPPANPRITNPTPTDASEDGSGSKTFRCTYRGCTKRFNSSSGLKKHEVRHKRPFGCTHGCTANNKPQTFGSKNDWKRHEESFHFDGDKPYLSWQCDGGQSGNSACREVFTTKAAFQSHLNEKHDGVKAVKKMAQERLNKCCLVTWEEAKYWCGFCKKTLKDLTDAPTSAGSVAAAFSGPAMGSADMPPNTIHYSRLLSSRFNHIDNHFSGRGYEEVTIESWVSLEQYQRDTSAAQVVSQEPQPSRVSSQTKSARDNRPTTKPLRDRARPGPNYFWECCHCKESCSQFNTHCPNCNVAQCKECPYEEIKLSDQ